MFKYIIFLLLLNSCKKENKTKEEKKDSEKSIKVNVE